MDKVPGLTEIETDRLAKLEVLEIRGFATADDIAHLDWLREKVDKRRIRQDGPAGTLWLSREGIRRLGKTVTILKMSGTPIRVLGEEEDED